MIYIIYKPDMISTGCLCVFWCVIEILMELCQHKAITSSIADSFPELFLQYARNGTYDSLDILAILLAGVTAFITLRILKKPS